MGSKWSRKGRTCLQQSLLLVLLRSLGLEGLLGTPLRLLNDKKRENKY